MNGHQIAQIPASAIVRDFFSGALAVSDSRFTQAYMDGFGRVPFAQVLLKALAVSRRVESRTLAISVLWHFFFAAAPSSNDRG